MRPAWQALVLCVLAIVAATVIAGLRGSVTPVLPRPAAPAAGGNVGLGTVPYDRIQISIAAANTRNAQALALCESDINTILAREFAELARKGDLAAAELAGYRSCCGIIFRLANDKVFGGSTASEYVDRELGGRLRPTLQACSRDLDKALAHFDRSLAESTVTLASELAQTGGGSGGLAARDPGRDPSCRRRGRRPAEPRLSGHRARCGDHPRRLGTSELAARPGTRHQGDGHGGHDVRPPRGGCGRRADRRCGRRSAADW
jgi:hypothetical protein